MKQMVKAIAVIIVMVMVIPALGMVSDATEVSASGNWSDQDNADITWHTGSQSHTYTLSTAGQLAGLAELVNGGNTFDDVTIELVPGKTYDLSAHQWTPIGAGTRSGSGITEGSPIFEGTFNGNGATITGLTITDSFSEDYAVGFFGIVSGGTVQDLIFTDVKIDVPNSEMAGTVAGMVIEGATISGCTVGSETDNSIVNAVCGNGGIVGRMTISGTIEDCTNYADINASGANSGGIVGAAYYTGTGKVMSIAGCVNYGMVFSTAGVAGGIVGLSSANVSGCVNYAEVTGNGADVAGIVAEQQNYGSVTDNVNYGKITNKSTVAYGTGGIVGWVRYNGEVKNYPLKAVIHVEGNTNVASIYGGNDAGGIVGTAYNAAVVKNNINTAPELKSSNFKAGVVGNAQFTEEPVCPDGTNIPKNDVVVSNNISTTPLEKMTGVGTCKGLYVYINDSNSVTAENNTGVLPDDWQLSVGNVAVDLGDTLKSMNDGSSLTVSGTGDTVSLIAESLSVSPRNEINLIIKVVTPSGASSSVTFSSSVLQSICEQLDAEIEVSLTIAPTAEVMNPIVPSGSVGYNIDLRAGETQISNLGGYVEVTLPFEPADGYSVNDYQIWYVDGNNVERYALNVEEDGHVSFSTTHFSEWYFVLDQPVYPDYGDDDESLPPFIPQQSSGNDDATLYIACCAAAAVVALLAIVMVMMERRK